MAEKYKTPEELGNAVGLKIEELFSTIVADLPPEEPEPQATAREQMKSVPEAQKMPPAHPRSAAGDQRSPAQYKPQQAKPPVKSRYRRHLRVSVAIDWAKEDWGFLRRASGAY